MKRPLRWLVRGVLGVLAFSVLACAIVIGALHTGAGRDYVRAKIVAQLQDSFPGSRIETLTGSPLGTLVLRGITLMARDGKPLVTVRELRVQAALVPLLSHRVVVEQLVLDGIRVSVRPQPPAPAVPPAAPGEPSAWTIELPEIALSDAAIDIATGSGHEAIEQLAVRASAVIPAGRPIGIDMHASARWRGQAVHVRALAAVGTTVEVPLATASLGDASTIVAGGELGDRLTGAVRAIVPAALARQLSGTELPGDGELLVDASTAVRVRATLASNRVDGVLVPDLAARRVRGIVEASAPQGTLIAAISADPTQVHGVLAGSAAALEGGAAFAATLTGAEVVAGVAAKDPVTGDAAVHARIERAGESWMLASSTVIAHTADPGTLRGRVEARLALHGPLGPEPVLAVSGTVDGTSLRQADVSLDTVHAAIAGELRPATQTLDLSLAAAGLQSGATRVPQATLAVDVVRTSDGTITARLREHRIETADHATWSGRGGTMTVTADAITITDIHAQSDRGELTASAAIGRTAATLSARVKARGIALAIVDSTLRGRVDADLDVARTGARWKGRATLHARGVASPGQPALDGDVTVALAGSKVSIDGAIANAQLGRATLVATIAGPRDITDVRAWRARPRSAIEHATLTLAGIDAGALGATGHIDSTLVLGARDTSGELHVRGLETRGGPVDVDVKLASTTPELLDVSATARTAGVPPAVAEASLALPARPFDPRAWQQLGRGALRSASVTATGLAIEPSLLARFGIVAPYRATVDTTLTADAGAANVRLTADVRQLAGERLTLPVDVHLEGTTGAAGTRAELTARAGTLGAGFVATSPLTIEGALAGGAPAAAVDATLTLPPTPARDLLGLLGETEVVSGTVGGTLTFAGTARAPTLHASIAAKRLAMAGSSITNRRPPTLDSLELEAMWSPQHAEVSLIGHEGTDRLLKVAARGDLHDWRSIVGSIEAANFDIAPLAVFAPGAARAARGTLNAALKIRGIDPQTGDVRGMLSIREGRFPLSPTLGTLRRTSLDVQIVKHQITATVDGRLGAGNGNIKGTLTAALTGGMPTSASLDMKLAKVSPIGALQPVIDGDVTGNWASPDGLHWSGSMAIRNGNVYVPPETGYDLLEAAAPTDMIFVDKVPAVKKIRRSTSAAPWLVTTIALGNTTIDVEDNDVHVLLTARGKLTATIGNGLDLRGMITTTRGTVDVLGRRYRVDNALLDFQGTTEPRLDIRMVHEFKDLTLTVDIRGTSLDPDLRLSGDPASYTQGQLLSFLMGAEPNADDSTAQTNQAVVSGGLTVLSSRIGRTINKHLPIKFDAINYEAGTSSSSKAVRFGLRLSDRAYLLWRQRLAARPDENPGEAVLEYQLRQSLLFETTVGERAKGGDLLYRYRW